MTYTLGQAAKATGKSKPTISRAIKKGTITATKDRQGQYAIDPAELHAVYPPLPSASNDTGKIVTIETPNNDKVLQAKLDSALERLAEKDTIIDDLKQERDDWKEEAKGVRLLVDHTEKKGFLARLFG